MADLATTAPPDPAALVPADPDEARRQAQCAGRWIAELNVSEKAQRKWLDRARKIARRYKRQGSDTETRRRFAMLWSNTQTIQPAVYTRPPQAVVSRRFQDADPLARICTEILERALSYSIDTSDLDGALRRCSFDYVLYGRGQTWERYVPTHGDEVTPEIDLQPVTGGEDYDGSDEQPDADDGTGLYRDDAGQQYGPDQVQQRPDGSHFALGQPFRPVVFEEAVTDYVNWEDFGHSVARTWDEVDYVWRRVYLSRDQLTDRFGPNLGKLVPLDWGPIEQGARDESARMQKKAAIYEIWCKSERKVYWISKSWASRPLDERDDPLQVPGFFPCPRPLLGTLANDTTIPTPDYVYYQDQAEEIDELTGQIAKLQGAIKVRGFYAGDGKTNLNSLLNSDTNILIPVMDWQSLKEDGGIRGRIEWFPIDQVVAALNALIAQRQQLINDVYQITGVADLLRGQGDPSATATAEGIKAQWGTLRIRDRQLDMMRFARDGLRIKGAVMANKFSAETLKAMTGVQLPTNADKAAAQAQIMQAQQQAQVQAQQQALQHQGATVQAQMQGQPAPPPPQPAPPPEVPPQVQAMLASPSWEDVEQLLQNNAMRLFRVDIETDSTIEPNEQQEKQATTEFIQAMGALISQWGPAIAAQPLLAPMAGALIKYGARRFRAGRELEDVIDTTVDKIVAASSSAPPPGAAGGKPATAPLDPTKIAVANIEQQTTQMQEAAETQREQMHDETIRARIMVQAGLAQAREASLGRGPTPPLI